MNNPKDDTYKKFDHDSYVRFDTPKRSYEKKIKYQGTLLAYIDIIGFKDKVKNSLERDDQLQTIYHIFQSQINNIKHTKNQVKNPDIDFSHPLRNLKIHSFSDHIVISSIGFDSNILRGLLHVVTHFLYEAIDRYYFFRGSVVFDNNYSSKDIIFGPALIKAYEIENNLANWPRIVVDISIIKKLSKKDVELFFNNYYFITDNDGLTYLDYLRYTFLRMITEENAGKPSAPWALPADFVFRQNRSAIVASIGAKPTVQTLTKFHQLANYHNKCIDRLITEFQDKFLFPALQESLKEHYIKALPHDKINLPGFFEKLYR
jgi:hypothetical protein